MNIFILGGDMTHLASFFVLLFRIHTTKSCAGISVKTHLLYALVFITRYLDLFTFFDLNYNTIMKLIFLVTSFIMLFYMRGHKTVWESYDKDLDRFPGYILLAFLLQTVIIGWSFSEMMWTYSHYLEAFAIYPQMLLLNTTKNIDNLTWQYVLLLGVYKPLYMANWICNYLTYPSYGSWTHIFEGAHLSGSLPMVSGIAQTIHYGVFCNFYINIWKNNNNVQFEEASECYDALAGAESGDGPIVEEEVSEKEKLHLLV